MHVCVCVCEKLNLDSDLRPFRKINSKWIIGLNVKDKLLGENTEGIYIYIYIYIYIKPWI
jgi:hypothetical protein